MMARKRRVSKSKHLSTHELLHSIRRDLDRVIARVRRAYQEDVPVRRKKKSKRR